jgi:hypothetical protein
MTPLRGLGGHQVYGLLLLPTASGTWSVRVEKESTLGVGFPRVLFDFATATVPWARPLPNVVTRGPRGACPRDSLSQKVI